MRRISARKIVLLIVAAASAGLLYLFLRPLPPVSPAGALAAHPVTTAVKLPWPADAQAAMGAEGYGLTASHGGQKPVPIASVSKVITALAVLQKRPLAAGQSGPELTLDSTDLGYFNYYYLRDGSVAQVAVGEKISEYQALQAMLLPSANNMADSLVRWAFGSTDDYLAYANQMVKRMGLDQTTVGNTNGFTDKTLSTSEDVVKLGLAAMDNPVIAGIVGQSKAAIPVEGTIHNVNYLLGQDSVVGIKTGNTNQAGGCFLFAAKKTVLGRPIILVGAVLGAKNLTAAIAAAPALIKASSGSFERLKIIDKSSAVATYQSAWGADGSLRPARDLYLTVWRGQDIKIISNPAQLTAPLPAGAPAGSLTIQSGQQTATTGLVLNQALPAPNTWWKLSGR